MKKIVILFSIAIISVFGTEPSFFSYTITSESMIIMIDSQTDMQFGETYLDNGDEIGVFNQNNICVGAVVWEEDTTFFAVFGETVTPPIDGLEEGELLTFKVWDSSEDAIYDSVIVAFVDYLGDPYVNEFDLSVPFIKIDSFFAYRLYQPTLVAPLDNSEDITHTPLMQWSSVNNATSYGLEIAEDGLFSTLVVDKKDAQSIAATSFTPETNDLEKGKEYFWRARAENSSETSDWSGAWSFITQLGTPELTLPADNAINQGYNPQFTWDAVDNANIYEFRITDDETLSTFLYTETNITVASFELFAITLSPYTEYFWQVRAKNDISTGEWSSEFSFTTKLTAPTLTTPADDAINQILNPDFAWSSVTGAAEYEYRISTDGTFATSDYTETVSTNALSLTLYNLSHNTEYFWQVKATDGSNESDWSETYSFTTLLISPVLATPSDGTINTSFTPTLSWNISSGAATYEIEVSDAVDFSNIIETADELTSTTYDVTTTLNEYTTYYWRVKAYNGTQESEWSEESSFTTKLTAPTLTTPTDDAINQSLNPDFAWSSVTGASEYDFRISSDETFATTDYTETVSTNSLSLTAYDLSYNTDYFWQVKAKDGANESDWSETYSLTTLLISPVLATPTDGTINTSFTPTLSWNASSGAVTYQIQVSNDSGFSSIVATSDGITNTSYSVSALPAYTTYYWRVKGKDGGKESEWSEEWSFTTKLTAPTLTTPADESINQTLNPDFAWSEVTEASEYDFRISTDGTFATSDYTETVSTNALSLTLYNLSHNTEYFWQVKATDGSNESDWSETYSFTTLLISPVLATPADESINIDFSPTLTWNASDGAATYEIEISDDSGFATTTETADELTSTTYDVTTTLDEYTTYYWRLKTYNGTQESEWSTEFSFTTKLTAPTLTTPTDHSINQSLNPDFAWSENAGASEYDFRISTDETFSTEDYSETVAINSLSLTLYDLSYNTEYFWQIKATYGANESDWSETFSFTTLLISPVLSTPADESINIGFTPTLSWSASSGAATYEIEVSDAVDFSNIIETADELTSTTYDVTTILNEYTTYYWRVKAYNSTQESEWATEFSFTTKLTAPTLTTPTDDAINQSLNPDFAWSSATGASEYDFRISTDETFASSDYTETVTTNSLSLTSFDLSYNTEYFWQVKATDADNESDWSEAFSFTTLLISPVLVTPADGTINTSFTPTLSWNTSSGAATYEIEVSDAVDFSNIIETADELTSTTYDVTTTLNEYTTFYWRVKAYNGTQGSEWSTEFSFTTKLTAPTLATPTDDAINQSLNPDFAWSENALASEYDFRISTDETFSTVDYSQTVTTNSLSLTLYDLSYNTEYFWQVKATDGANESDWSETYSFTTLLISPVLVTPADESINVGFTPTLTWESSDCATTYEIEVSDAVDFSNIIETADELTSITYDVVTSLNEYTSYYWRVKAYNGTQESEWVTEFSFTTKLTAPTLTTPTDDAINQSLNPDFAWTENALASEYDFRISTDETFSSSDYTETVTTNSLSLSSYDLSYNTEYFWQVKATGGANESDWSETFSFTTLLISPVLTTPADESINVGFTPTLTWNSSDGAATYEIAISDAVDFSNIIETADELTSTNYDVTTTLNEYTTYYWRVKAYNGTQESEWSEEWSFTTKLTAPTLTTPIDNSINQSLNPDFAWSENSGASEYDFRISTDETFASSEHTETVTTNSLSLSSYDLSYNTEYFWQVKATDGANESDWSETYSFTTLLISPVLTTPADESINVGFTPTLTWNSSDGAATYEIEISDAVDFSNIIETADELTSTNYDVTTTLNEYTTYYWRVKAYNVTQESEWSEEWSFTTKLSVPTLAIPIDDAINQSLNPDFAWTENALASEYDFRISTDETFASSDYTETVTTNSLSLSSYDLSYNTEYFWQVKATYGANESDWSETFSFTTLLISPVLSTPADESINIGFTPTLSWSASSGAATYEIEVSDAVDFSNIIETADELTSTTYDVTTTLDEYTTYYWRLKTYNGTQESEWSTEFSFTTKITAPTLATPTDDAINQSLNPDFAWSSITGASEYDFRISTDETFSTVDYSETVATNSLSLTLYDLSYNTEYFWQVKATDGANESDWSETYSFTTLLISPVLTTPADESINVGFTPTLTWNSSDGAATYEIEISDAVDFSNIIETADDLTSTNYDVTTALNEYTTYYWRVKAYNGTQESEWATEFSFTTKLTAPNLATPTDDAINQSLNPDFAWSSVTGASEYDFRISTDETFASSDYTETVTTNSLSLTSYDLSYNTEYYWQVKAKDGANESDWSETFSFTTLLVSPVLATPADESINVGFTPTLTWESSDGATTYEIEVSDAVDFSNIVETVDELTSTTYDVTTTLNEYTTYYWRVKAYNGTQESEWSTEFSFTTKLTAPTLTTPTDDAINQSLNPDFAWSENSGANEYDFRISTDETFASSDYTETVTTNSLSLTLYDLSYNTEYFWQVKATDGAKESDWSETYSLTTLLISPVLATPTDGTINTSFTPTLSWNASSGAVTYQIQVSNDSGFSSIVATSDGITNTSYSVSALPAYTTYYWRVKGKDGGKESEWSEEWSFTTKLTAPTLATPTDDAINQSLNPDFAWSSATGASEYDFRISTDETFASSDYTETVTTNSLSLTSFDLSYNTEYFWQVKATDADNESDWSEAFSFTTLLISPVLVTPADGTINTSFTPTLSWNTSSGAATYEIELSDAVDFSNIIETADELTSTTYDVTTTLNEYTTFYWRVKAYNGTQGSEWSTEFSFTTKLTAPTLATPTDDAINQSLNPDFAWSENALASEYDFRISTDETFSTVDYSQTVATNSLSLTLYDLSYNTEYFWQVKATDGANESDWSETFSFTTLLISPVLVTPADGAINTSFTPTLSWNTSSGAATYEIELSDAVDFSNIVETADELNSTSYEVITTLDEYTTYYWRVKAYNGTQESDWSSAFSFSTKLTAPTLATPTDDAINQLLNPDFAWSSVTGASEYDFRISIDETFSTVDYSETVTTNSLSLSSYDLSYNTEYFWQVKATDGDNESDWSETFSFTTLLISPVLVTPADESINVGFTPTLSWNTSSGAATYEIELSNAVDFSNIIETADELTSTSYEVITTLDEYTTYYWRLKAYNGSQESKWSEGWSFATELTAPTLPTPTDDARNQLLNPDFAWSSVTGASEYDFRISTDETFASSDYTETVTTNSLSLTSFDLSYNTEYYWQVKATDGANESDWSETYSFTTLLISPVLATPADESINTWIHSNVKLEYIKRSSNI
jgi:hypothetical protein